MSKRIVKLELRFEGDGTVRRTAPGAFSGGVVVPETGGQIGFTLHRELSDDEGVSGPVPGELGIRGTFQLNLFGTTKGFRELGRYFLGLAELDSAADPDYHEHFDGLLSLDSQTMVNVVVRKQEANAG